ncbi:MAG: phytanoyl-CoA dioxygenase family protein [Fimbriimonas sp.]|jgi:phytanoyl-CoA hydroxylase
MSITFDHIPIEEYANNLYRSEVCVTPINGLAAFDQAMIEQYHELGFVSVANAINQQEIDSVLGAMLDIVLDENAKGVQLQFENEARGKVEEVGRDRYLDYVRKFMWFSHLHPATQTLMYHPELVKILENLLGGEVEMFQDMALLKPPGIGREKPWHQDHAYFNLPEGTPVVGVWIALDDATPDNGCMHFLPGRHKQGPVPHWDRRDWQICDSEILSASGQVATPLPAGGCLIFDGLTPHGTPTNRSNTRRRAIQWHYVRKGTPRTTTEERMAIFGNEGKEVSC